MQCALCLKNKPLMSSHLLPASIYKKIKTYDGTSSKILSITDDAAVYSDLQIQKLLLCHDCEELLNTSGEKQVCKDLARSENEFQLLSWFRNEKQQCIYASPENNEYNSSQYLYFALSVFWRASVTSWKNNYSFCEGLMGAEERIRQYLLTQKMDFVSDIHLIVYVNNNPPYNPLSCLPQIDQNGPNKIFFVVPGIIFLVFLYNSIIGAEELNKQRKRVIFVEYDFERFFESSGFVKTILSAPPKGKYAFDRHQISIKK